ncbi:hypothetical protein HYX00_01655 [Candidatus Woesearchaeota archaeon]|nr:hypothetical protein [Candidatus Woesearchaeota archaeon]
MQTKQPKKYLLDSNIYGEMVVDAEIEQLKDDYKNCKNFILIYGIKEIIRKELRATPKDARIKERKLRSNLIGLYDIFTGKHELSITEEHKKLADDYYKSYIRFGGSKSKDEMFNDFLVVACASSKELDVVVSEDEKTMLTENAIKAYNLVNAAAKRRTPRFIGYIEFKRELRSSLPNKFISRSNKLWVLLVFLNLFYELVKISFFPFHDRVKNNPTIKNFRI